MDTLLFVKTVIMGLVEGLTEFLPISSTGHLILASELLGFDTAKGKVFEIVIQTGAMLAIVWEYRTRFTGVLTTLGTDRASRRFAANVVMAVIPAVLFGLAFGSTIKAHLFSPVPVAVAFVVGGIVILWAERRHHRISVAQVDDLTWRHALKVGCIQCLALIPGTSRAGATIIGGLWLGLSRRAATEFSFFLAVPTLVGAGAHQLYTERLLLSQGDIVWFAVGSLAAFIAALLCVRWLMRYISTHDFTVFAWYRIVFGLLVLATSYSGVVDWTSR